jgi:hypothetical protein
MPSVPLAGCRDAEHLLELNARQRRIARTKQHTSRTSKAQLQYPQDRDRMQELEEAVPPWDSLPYLDSILGGQPRSCRSAAGLDCWRCTRRASWSTRSCPALDTLRALRSSGLDEEGVLWLLRRFCRRVATAPLQDCAQAGGRPGAWKNSVLLDLLRAQVCGQLHVSDADGQVLHCTSPQVASTLPAMLPLGAQPVTHCVCACDPQWGRTWLVIHGRCNA